MLFFSRHALKNALSSNSHRLRCWTRLFQDAEDKYDHLFHLVIYINASNRILVKANLCNKFKLIGNALSLSYYIIIQYDIIRIRQQYKGHEIDDYHL